MYMTRKLLLATLLVATSCDSGNVAYYDSPWDPYYYPWHYSPYGSWTVVRRPLPLVDGWTRREFQHRRYRGRAIERHNSPQITYTATQGDHTYEVILTGRNDSTQVEVRSRRGADKFERQQARELMGRILSEYKVDPPRQER
jgi:hypothetical protein